MTTPLKLGLFAVVLALVFAIAFAAGSLVDDPAEPERPAEMEHSP